MSREDKYNYILTQESNFQRTRDTFMNTMGSYKGERLKTINNDSTSRKKNVKKGFKRIFDKKFRRNAETGLSKDPLINKRLTKTLTNL